MVLSTPSSSRRVHQCRFTVRWIIFSSKPEKTFFTYFLENRIINIHNPICKLLFFLFVGKKSYPSNTVFTIFLGAVWLCVDLRSAETFEHSAIMVFTWLYVTHVSILTSDLLKFSFGNSFLKYRTFRYPTKRINQNKFEVTVLLSSFRWITLAPIHLRRNKARPVIYYDFIIGWLLPSPPPGCLCFITSFSTQWLLKDLNVRSGLFPSWLKTLAP
jgi:hypothetical protein